MESHNPFHGSKAPTSYNTAAVESFRIAAKWLCTPVVALSHALGRVVCLPEPAENVHQADPLPLGIPGVKCGLLENLENSPSIRDITGTLWEYHLTNGCSMGRSTRLRIQQEYYGNILGICWEYHGNDGYLMGFPTGTHSTMAFHSFNYQNSYGLPPIYG